MLAWGLPGWKSAHGLQRPWKNAARAVLLSCASLGGCGPACDDPRAVVEAAVAALTRGDVAAVEARVHPAYSDPVGDRAQLLADLEALAQATPRVTLSEVEVLRGPQGPTLVGKLEAHLAGPPEWTVVGPLRLELASHDGALAIRTGFLDDLRDLRALMSARRAGLESNDADALGALIHPEYRDGALDRDGAVARLRDDVAGIAIRIEPRSYWAEVRGLDAHVDERYVLRLGEAEHAAIARFTARRAAGRWRLFAGLYPATAE